MKLPTPPALPTPDSTVYGPNRSVLGHAHLSAKVQEYAIAYGTACARAALEGAAKVLESGSYRAQELAGLIRAIEVET